MTGNKTLEELQERVNDMAERKGWHRGLVTSEWITARLALVHAEVSEAVECVRKSKPTEELAEELADIVIRVLCVASAVQIDVSVAVEKKMAKNERRNWDHIVSGLT